jgi:NRPS condensation-like uncharacterized protein
VCPQIEALLKQWEKKDKEPKKAPALTEDEVERILWLPIGAGNITMLVSYDNVLFPTFNFVSLASITNCSYEMYCIIHRLVLYFLSHARYALPI